MKRNVILTFLISVMVASLGGCILSSSPTESTVTLKVDAQQTFAVTGFLNGAYVWSKNKGGADEVIADATSASYDYTALAADKGTFVLKVQTTDLLSQQILVKQWTVTVTQNLPPVAEAGTYPDYNLVTGGVVQLDGSGSSDPDGDTLSYHWILETRPDGSAAALTDAFSVNPTFTPDVAGAYSIRLIVSDGENDVADTASVIAYVGNRAPTANAGTDAEIYRGASAQLDGSASSDPDGNTLTYTWRIVTIPDGSTAATISDTTSATPTFTPDVKGTYTLGLVVHDSEFSSTEDTVTITVTNRAPIADAGDDDTVDLVAGETYTLDGSGSMDPDSNPITYAWTIVDAPEGSTATLSDPTIVNPTFTPNVKGAYTFKLVVSDGDLSAEDEVIITTSNHVPVAEANTDIEISFGNSANLTGALSTDPDGDTLTYAWTVASAPEGSAATITNPTGMEANFKPDVKGVYVIQLIVNDGTYDSAPDTMTITTKNDPPVAEAGNDITAHLSTLNQLDASASSDPNGDSLTFQWEILSRPVDSIAQLSATDIVNPTFLADKTGEYTIQLTVNDGETTATDTIKITAYNNAPTANAGEDQSIFFNGSAITAQLTGSGTDLDEGTTLTYAWTLSAPAGSAAVLDDPASATPTFAIDVIGTYTCQLVVSDGDLTGTDTVVITATNGAPVANAGIDQSGYVNTVVTLAGSGIDPEGQSLNYTWSIVSVPPGSAITALSNPYIANPTFTPDKKGEYVFSLVVDDGVVSSVADTVTITVGNRAPVAESGTSISNITYDGRAVSLNGSGSADPDGDTITYAWTITSFTPYTGVPSGITATITNETTATPTVTLDKPGTYVISLVVNDGTVSSDADTLTLTTATSTLTTNWDDNVMSPWYVISTSGSQGTNGITTDQYVSSPRSFKTKSCTSIGCSGTYRFGRDIGTYVMTMSWYSYNLASVNWPNVDLYADATKIADIPNTNSWKQYTYTLNQYVSTHVSFLDNQSYYLTGRSWFVDNIVITVWTKN